MNQRVGESKSASEPQHSHRSGASYKSRAALKAWRMSSICHLQRGSVHITSVKTTLPETYKSRVREQPALVSFPPGNWVKWLSLAPAGVGDITAVWGNDIVRMVSEVSWGHIVTRRQTLSETKETLKEGETLSGIERIWYAYIHSFLLCTCPVIIGKYK